MFSGIIRAAEGDTGQEATQGERMTSIDYEAEYNNRRRVPGSAAIMARWQAASDACRGTAGAEPRPALWAERAPAL